MKAKLLITTILAMSLTGCATTDVSVSSNSLRALPADAIKSCVDLSSFEGETFGDLVDKSIVWKKEHADCASRHDQLINFVKSDVSR